MNDRPLTLVLIAVAILIALYIRRKRTTGIPVWEKSGQSTLSPEGITVEPVSTRVIRDGMVTPEQARREGEVRGIRVDLSQPLTREQFERLMGPVSVK